MTTFFNKVCDNVNNFNNNVNDFLDDKFKKIDNFTGSSLYKFDAQHGGCLKTAVKVAAAVLLVLAVVSVLFALVHGGAVAAAGGGVAVAAKHAAAVGGKASGLVAKHSTHLLPPPVPHGQSASGGTSVGAWGVFGALLALFGGAIGGVYAYGKLKEPEKLEKDGFFKYALGKVQQNVSFLQGTDHDL